ncbi:hypothetical protein CMV_010915 [Castanea mollissima]|uniref:Aminotransferase-like plant mobile domain-containing protein n=1 Tax=Castanea mollissima TaxID=60419 RepID=A0A8J4R685_9ROSI|nr:hypothetical protein CMV_010915 [Castanea mollissima]
MQSMAAVAEVDDEFGPGPRVPSVLRFLTEHRSSAVWEGQDPGVLKCRGRNEEFRKRSPMVDDRVLDIVKRIGLEGLMDLPPDGAYGPPLPSSPLSIKLVWVVSTKNSPAEICLVRYRQLLDSMYPNQVVWQPYEAELGHLPAFCVAGRDMWTARVPLVCFWLVEKHTPDRVLRQFGMVQEIPEDVDTDDALHKIDLRGKIEVDWRVRHFSHIQVWNTRAQKLCHGARLEGAMSSVHPYFGWYGKVTWRFVDHTSASLLITVAMHKQMLMRYVVDSPEHKLITAMLKEVDRLHRLAAHLPLEDADTANPELPEHNGRPSTSSTPASHSHGQCAAPHQRQNQPPPPPHASPAPEFPPPPHASPAPEFPPPPHASPSPEIPPRTTPAFPDLQIPVPTARGHKAGHKAGPTQCKEPDEGDAVPPPPHTRHYTRQRKRQVP